MKYSYLLKHPFTMFLRYKLVFVFYINKSWLKKWVSISIKQFCWNSCHPNSCIVSHWGGGTPIHEDGGGTSALLTPIFDIFRSHWVPFLCPTRSYWPSLSAKKICLSLLHLVSEKTWRKVGLLFHKNLSFWSNLYQFSHWFSILLTPFFIVIRYFWPFIFTKP